MTPSPDRDALARQEARFARAFAAAGVAAMRPLYHPEVRYTSPTVRLFGWPREIEGVDRTLEFIALTIRSCRRIRYEAVELAPIPGAPAAFVRIHFDWDAGSHRLRSDYVVRYRYRDGLIAAQQLYYDPDGTLEVLGAAESR